VTKQQWRIVVISTAAVAFSITAGLEPPLRNLLNFAKAGTSFIAKQLCSGVLMAGMDPDQMLKEDLAAGQGMIHTQIEPSAGRVKASSLFGLIRAEAVQNGERGCTWRINGQPTPRALSQNKPGSGNFKPTEAPWPLIATAQPEPPEIDRQALNRALDHAFEENDPLLPKRTRAVVVVQDGWVIAERYAKSIPPDMPLIGWSMSKSITHALIGRAIHTGLLDPDKPPKVPEWSDPQDPRQKISLDQLLRMNSGLAFEESTGALNSDLVRMLTQEADMAGFAASKSLSKKPGKKWNYSSGTTNILSRILRHAIDDDQHYWSFPSQALFGPLGMTTAVLESDNSGTLVGSSLAWASGRDWARFGQLYLDQGSWNGKQLLPANWVQQARTASRGSKQAYGAHWWLSRRKSRPDLPKDSFSAEGYQGQLLLVAPSQRAVIVRLGQTPKKPGFDANAFGADVLSALR
jgi:CubicO group peptidase (beta-lactamase class C family)